MIIPKVVVLGPESTGKSTLSAAMADAFQTVWVPEYARDYLLQLNRSYTPDDLVAIARGQIQLEDEMEKEASDVLICDTDLYVLKVWSEHKYNNCDRFILQEIARRRYDLYLLTFIDVKWEEDPLREHPDEALRNYFYQIYRDIVIHSGTPWVEIRGHRTEREKTAKAAIEKLFDHVATSTS